MLVVVEVYSLDNPMVMQIKARLDALQQKLQSDVRFRQAYPMQVTKEMQLEKQLEAQLVKQVRHD